MSRTLLVWWGGSDLRLTLHDDTGVVDEPGGSSTLSPPRIDDHKTFWWPYNFFAVVGHAATCDPTRHRVDVAGPVAYTVVGPGSRGRG